MRGWIKKEIRRRTRALPEDVDYFLTSIEKGRNDKIGVMRVGAKGKLYLKGLINFYDV
jgi:hypothetical protein